FDLLMRVGLGRVKEKQRGSLDHSLLWMANLEDGVLQNVEAKWPKGLCPQPAVDVVRAHRLLPLCRRYEAASAGVNNSVRSMRPRSTHSTSSAMALVAPGSTMPTMT